MIENNPERARRKYAEERRSEVEDELRRLLTENTELRKQIQELERQLEAERSFADVFRK